MSNEASLKRLILVKRLYLEGINKSNSQNNYADQMLSVINWFLAVETAMGAIVQETDQPPGQAKGTKGYAGKKPPTPQELAKFSIANYHSFDKLHDQVIAILRDRGILGEDEILFKLGPLERLQKARNDAQHSAKAPHPMDLPELAQTTKEFIERILKLNFSTYGNSLAEISLANLLKDEVLKKCLIIAENALSEKNFHKCTLFAHVAFLLGRLKRRFDWWKDRDGDKIIDDYDVHDKISSAWMDTDLSDKIGTDPVARLLREMMFESIKLPYLFDNWILGLDSTDRGKLNRLTPRLTNYPENMEGSQHSDEIVISFLLDELILEKSDWKGPDFQSTPSEDDCLWVCDYVTETLLRWQQEGRGRFSSVDRKYLAALQKLEEYC